MRKDRLCRFEKAKLEGFDDKDIPALTAHMAAAIVSSSKNAESGSGGIEALDQSKTVGKGRMIEAVRSGGRDGLIGGSEKSLSGEGFVDKVFVVGHGHEHSNTNRTSSLGGMRSPELHQPGHTQR